MSEVGYHLTESEMPGESQVCVLAHANLFRGPLQKQQMLSTLSQFTSLSKPFFLNCLRILLFFSHHCIGAS